MVDYGVDSALLLLMDTSADKSVWLRSDNPIVTLSGLGDPQVKKISEQQVWNTREGVQQNNP
jgi:hypothetical protein